MNSDPMDNCVDNYVLLAGRPSVLDFVRFIKRNSIDGYLLDEKPLNDEWNEARNRVQAVETAEAGLADASIVEELPASLAAYAEAALQRSLEVKGVGLLPYKWCMVELDRMIVYQKTINLRFVDQLRSSFPSPASMEDLVDIAVGASRTLPPLRVTQVDGNTYTFVSPSNDLRILQIAPFAASSVQGHKLREQAALVLGAFVGYGSNLLQAVRLNDRTILSNGSHRAYALRSLGFKRIPCLVQFAKEHDMDVLGLSDVRQNPDRYLRAPRPPMFKDYFDSRLHRIVDVPRRNLMLQVELTIKQSSVPSL